MSIKPIDPISLKKRLDRGDTILIDVREPHEHAREHIEGARLVPLSRLSAEDFSDVRDKIAVFHCQSGRRTGINARLLTSTGLRDAYHLNGGIAAWKAAGLATKSERGSATGSWLKRLGWF